tara:strand:- start:35 stop:478 length:444 start_codon:yes stop_codon:yes gene_type:complete
MFNSLLDIVDSNEERISWQQYFMSIAFLTSVRSACSRLHVGCVLVKNNRIISSGYNGFLPNAPHKSIVVDDHEIATVHAEQNTISDAAKRGVNVNGSTAYITHYPCIHCAKLLAASGISNIYYHHDYKNNKIVEEILSPLCIPINRV